MDSLEEARRRAASFRSSRHASSTRNTYAFYQKQFVSWCEENCEQLVEYIENEEKTMVMPVVNMKKLEYDQLELFFCDARKKKPKNTRKIAEIVKEKHGNDDVDEGSEQEGGLDDVEQRRNFSLKRKNAFRVVSSRDLTRNNGEIENEQGSDDDCDGVNEPAYDEADGEDDGFLSVNALGIARSAIKDLYFQQKVKVPDWWDSEVTNLFKGMKKKEAQRKQSETIEIPPLTHLFGILCWNLICRGDNTETLSLNHIEWLEDSLVIYYDKMKNDQTGERVATDLKHIYANIHAPHLCPILALAIYLSTSSQPKDTMQLFPGGSQKSRVLKAIHTSLSSGEGQRVLQTVGKKVRDFGNHSFRKGATTFATSGSVNGPSAFAVLLRGGWKLGGVLSRYIKGDAAGDQFVGRILSGLNPNSPEFAALPPHFTSWDPIILESMHHQFPCFVHHHNLREVLKMCLASLVYHRRYLKENLPVNHGLFYTYIFKSADGMKPLEEIVTVEPFGMLPTGIPAHVSILVQLRELQQSSSNIGEEILAGVEKIIKEQGAFAPHATAYQLGEMEKRLNATIEKMACNMQPSRENAIQGAPSAAFDSLYCWGGAFRRLPQSFEFPAVNVRVGLSLWLMGNKEKKYPPFQTIQAIDLVEKKKIKTLSEWRLLYSYLLEQLKQKKRDID